MQRAPNALLDTGDSGKGVSTSSCGEELRAGVPVDVAFAPGLESPAARHSHRDALEDSSRQFDGETATVHRVRLDALTGSSWDQARRHHDDGVTQSRKAQNAPPAKNVKPVASEPKPVKLLSRGNPQITKADGDAPRASLHRGDARLEA